MADDLPAASDVLAHPAATTEPESEKVDEASEQKKDVPELLSEGNAALALGKYAEASEHFAFAVEKLVEKHGEMAIETVDALEAYGNALLKNAIASSAVLGGDGTASASKDKEEKTDATNTTTAGEGTASSATASTSVPAAASSSASTSKATAPKEPVTANNIRFSFGGDAADDEEEEEGDDDEDGEENGGAGGEEEVDDFETAWEVLDTARAILAKTFPSSSENIDDTTKSRQLQLARIHSSMAEIATESGRPEDGVKEYETALSIQSSLLEPWDRLTAQTHLFLALALELIPSTQLEESDEGKQKVAEQSFGKAVEHVEKAVGILEKRKEHIMGREEYKGLKGKGKEEDVTKDMSEKDRDEMKDLEELSAELSEKIEDLKAQITEAQQKPASLQEQIFQTGPSLPENVSREVHNLNSLVKKKKKPEPASANSTEAAGKETSGTKRKAEEELKKDHAEVEGSSNTDKKTRVDDDE